MWNKTAVSETANYFRLFLFQLILFLDSRFLLTLIENNINMCIWVRKGEGNAVMGTGIDWRRSFLRQEKLIELFTASIHSVWTIGSLPIHFWVHFEQSYIFVSHNCAHFTWSSWRLGPLPSPITNSHSRAHTCERHMWTDSKKNTFSHMVANTFEINKLNCSRIRHRALSSAAYRIACKMLYWDCPTNRSML